MAIRTPQEIQIRIEVIENVRNFLLHGVKVDIPADDLAIIQTAGDEWFLLSAYTLHTVTVLKMALTLSEAEIQTQYEVHVLEYENLISCGVRLRSPYHISEGLEALRWVLKKEKG